MCLFAGMGNPVSSKTDTDYLIWHWIYSNWRPYYVPYTCKTSPQCELSGGQCQRVAIARALALNPKVLCFDEPTSALDPELTGEVLKVIRSLKDQDRTMIIVTHEMGFAKNVSDKVIFLYDGVVEEEGKPRQVFEKPKSEKLMHFLSNISEKDGESKKANA